MQITVELTVGAVKWVEQQAKEWGITPRETLEEILQREKAKTDLERAVEHLNRVGLRVSEDDVAESVERVLQRQGWFDVQDSFPPRASALLNALERREGQKSFDRSKRPAIEQAAAAARSKEVIRKLEAQERAASV